MISNLPTTFKERIVYFSYTFKILGRGTGRIVYDYDSEHVLKVARNKKGIEQNRSEVSISQANPNNDVLAKITEHHPDFLFVIQKKAAALTEDSFLAFTKNKTLDDFFYFIRFNREVTTATDVLTQQVSKIVETHHLDRFDISDKSSWGSIGDKPVLVDYGLTINIARTMYKAHY